MHDDDSGAVIVNTSSTYCPACRMAGGYCWWHQLPHWQRKTMLMTPERRHKELIKRSDAERLIERRDARPADVKPTSRERQNEAAAARCLAEVNNTSP